MSSKGAKVHKVAASEPLGFGSQVGSAGKHGKNKKDQYSQRHRKREEKEQEKGALTDDESASSYSQQQGSESGSTSSRSRSSSMSGSEEAPAGAAARHHARRGEDGKYRKEFSSAAAAGAQPPVQALYSEAHPWKTTVMTISVNGSLEELDAKKMESGAVLRILGDGVRIDRTTPSVRSRIAEKAKVVSQADVQKKPLALIKGKDIVREVRVIAAHNGYPCALHFRVPNLVASAGEHSFTAADGSETNEACFTLNSGEKLEDHVVFRNDVRPEDIKLMSDYKTFTPQNLDEGVKPLGERNGVSYVSVPYTADKPHPVVDLARRKIPLEEMTSEQRARYGNGIPPELLSQSRDWPDQRIMAADLWEKYRDRTAKGMRESNPHSDMAHPVVLVSRLIDTPAYAKGGVASKSAKYDKVTSQGNWLHSSQIYTDRSTPESKASVTSTPRQAWVKLEIRSSEIETLGSASTSL